MKRIRVLIVEDSLTVRKRLVDVINSDPDLEVVAEGEDGRAAIELCQRLRPDVITMDMMLPVMSGLAATEYIMAHCPTPILIVSASTNRGELFRTYDALRAGALDALEKPLGVEENGWDRKLIQAVKLASRIKVITHVRGRLGPHARSPEVGIVPAVERVSSRARSIRAIAIGASTGGPGAVVRVLESLPLDFPVPVLLVVHIGEPFASAFAEWLDGLSRLRVRYVEDGEPLPDLGKGVVLLAPPERHLVLSEGKLRLTRASERNHCRPSIDVLFESVACELGAESAACLLTGMGKDGALGLLEIRRAGGFTIAQDEASSVVFGMPREAILLGAAERILSIGEIGPTLAALDASPERRRRT